MAADLHTMAILATGPSMSQAVADQVRAAGIPAVAVSDAWTLAPWARALVSHDRDWWHAHPEAKTAFAGRKVAGMPTAGCDVVRIGEGSNSGLLACHVAVRMGAKRLLLCGFDMQGDHFFGRHPDPLKHTTPERFAVFRRQFARFQPPGVQIVNCTPHSALTVYPILELEEALQ